MFALLSAARKALTSRDQAPNSKAHPRPLRRSRRALVLTLPALALASACQPVSLGGTGPSINTSKPVPVALLVPKGSGKSGDAILAASLENAARLAASELNGVQIDLRVYDTQGSAEVTAGVTSQAISDGAKVILGPVYAANANAAGRVAASRGVNVLAFSNNPEIAGGNVFILGPTFQNTADRLTRYAVTQGKNNIVLVHGQTPEGQAGASAVQTAALRNGASIVGTVPYEFSQQGVLNALPAVRDAAGGGAEAGGADAIFLTANTAGALPLFTQMLPENGLGADKIQYIGLTRWDIPPQTLALPGVQGGWFALPDPGLTAQFNARYTAAYGAAPHPIGGLAFDGIAAIGALVRQGRSDALSTSGLTQGSGFQGVGGVFRLLPDGTNERGLAVATIQDQQVVVIAPAPRSFSGAGF
ncbi:amino acid/amide ABC transporter substrate-binding protein, HAAT family [Pseudooceanicola antarcticus]|uniref:Amino acid/amide ABC transporter substrate-binding protein, HAAT family n=1 Tax=Pseudooceanicola antarcticus TaxID=1247613 RepID=A0A285IRH7_9RHOB|nr:penicillin-binding protein activator [Pseudooceanicola antarcticus]PJE31872.1 penicillin-binding protein activator [Pseudooceanicola antarcticus]SNY50630.1 amino acid/amide ABC transporter substrate-binding protein, HAAT family [Pseudooceanicola antarcticus]